MYFDVDGKRVFAATGGECLDPQLPAVVFLHGSGFDHTFWNLYSRFFADRHYTVLAPDFPGHTKSQGPPLTSIEAMADWLDNLIETAALGEVSIVAHSQGCLVALELASRYREKLKCVSFIASGLTTPVNSNLLDAARNDPESAIAMMLNWGFGPASTLHEGAMSAGSRQVLRGNVPDVLAADLAACNAYQNGRAAAAGIGCPVQVILGGKDRMAPRKSVMELAAHLHQPALHVIEDGGHMLPLEAPDRCLQLLQDFIFTHNPAN